MILPKMILYVLSINLTFMPYFVFANTANPNLMPAITLEYKRGGTGPGGGDPRAVEFRSYSRKIDTYFGYHQSFLTRIDRKLLSERVNYLGASLNTNIPKIRVPQTSQIDDCVLGPKQGCTREDGSVDLAGLTWDSAKENFKCVLTAQELLVPLTEGGRYEEEIKTMCEEILKIPQTDFSCSTENLFSCDSFSDDGSFVIIDNPRINVGGKRVMLRAYSDVDSTEKFFNTHLLCRKLGFYTGKLLKVQYNRFTFPFFYLYRNMARIGVIDSVEKDRIGIIEVSDDEGYAMSMIRCERE